MSGSSTATPGCPATAWSSTSSAPAPDHLTDGGWLPGAGQLGDRRGPALGRAARLVAARRLRRAGRPARGARPGGVRRAVAQGRRPPRRPGLRHRYDTWLSWFEEHGHRGRRLRLDQPAPRRPAAGRPTLLEWPYDVEQPIGPAIAAWGDAVDRLRGLADDACWPDLRREDVRQETVGRPGAEDPRRSCCASSAACAGPAGRHRRGGAGRAPATATCPSARSSTRSPSSARRERRRDSSADDLPPASVARAGHEGFLGRRLSLRKRGGCAQPSPAQCVDGSRRCGATVAGARARATGSAVARKRPTQEKTRGTQARHRRVAQEGPDDRRLPRQGYVVESSIGHIRDLPNNAADTPAKIKDKPWGRLAVDVDNGFEPYYVVPRDKKSHIAKLKKLLKDADELYLATDEDREGEAIAWHLLDELSPKGIPVKRMVFHEITKSAILAAAEAPRELDMDLVEAQETRRILDRLYGYEVSPVLWRKVMSGLSAGRVQSVATRLVVDRERERMKFKVASYWDLEGTFDAGSKHEQRMFPAKLHSLDGARVARGSDFGQDGVLKKGGIVHLDRARAEALAAASRHDVRRPLGRVQALPPLALCALPHHHAPAGGQPQARHELQRHDVGRAAPLRGRLHHLHAYRLDHALGHGDQRRPGPGAGALRRRVRPRRAADLHQQGEERPGGPRGDPPRRRLVPHARPDRPDRRPVPALRADLDAHRRLADEGRASASPSRSASAARPRPARTPSSPRAAASSPSTASSRPTSRAPTTRPSARRRGDPPAQPHPRARPSRPPRSRPRATRPSRRPATPRRR